MKAKRAEFTLEGVSRKSWLLIMHVFSIGPHCGCAGFADSEFGTHPGNGYWSESGHFFQVIHIAERPHLAAVVDDGPGFGRADAFHRFELRLREGTTGGDLEAPVAGGHRQDPHQAPAAEDPGVLMYLVQWDTQDEVEEHFRSERFRRLLPYIEMSVEPPEVEVSAIDRVGGMEFLVGAIGAARG